MKLFIALLLISGMVACTGTESERTTEKIESERIDSSSREIDKIKQDLEAQTQKVEQNLEELDENN